MKSKSIAVGVLLASVIGCSPGHYLKQGDTDHILFLKMVKGETTFESKTIEIKNLTIVIVDNENKMPCINHWKKNQEIFGCADQNTLYIKGKKVNGKYIIPPAVTGHELGHVIENTTDVMPIHQYQNLQ